MKKNNITNVKKSLDEINNITRNLNENTSKIVQMLLSEAMAEDITSDDDKDEDEVEETEVEETENSELDITSDEVKDTDSESGDNETSDEDTKTEDETSDMNQDDKNEEDEWSQFEDYKLSDNEYDFLDAKGDDVVKVWKLLQDDDKLVIVKDDDKLNIKDNETGAEYIIELGDDCDPNDNNNEFENMSESKIYEVDLGYTDNYQDVDAMTTPEMTDTNMPGTRDIHKGIPTGKEKPFSKLKAKAAPFNENEEIDMVEEEELLVDDNSNEDIVEEGDTISPSAQRRMSKTKAHGESLPYGSHVVSKKGDYVGTTNESILKKVNSILKENKELKKCLSDFKKCLQEAAVTNYSLGQIVKLITENTTSQDEKTEIIKRFTNEVSTIEQSKALYESIKRELKRDVVMEKYIDKQFIAEGSKKINETVIHKSSDLLKSLGLMDRMERI